MIHFAIILLGALVMFMIAGGIPLAAGAQTVVFRTPIFMALLGVLCVLLVLGCARYGRGQWRRAAFWPAHLGIVLILAGAALGLLLAERGEMALPVDALHKTDCLPSAKQGAGVPLGFALSVSDFKVDYYDPRYRLFTPTTDHPRSAQDYICREELALTSAGELQIQGYGTVARATLWDPSQGAWVPNLTLTNGWILERGSGTPKVFVATLETDCGGVTATHTLKVNRPVTVGEWRVYLMSYETNPRPYVQLFLRRDPGRRLAITGIWCVIGGVAALCWRRDPAYNRKGSQP
jgi:hypothetical protein